MVFLDCNWYQSVRLDPSFLALTERRAEKEMPGVSQVNPSGWIFTVFSCHCICVRSLALQDLNIHGRNTKTASTSEHSPFVNVAIFVHMQILFRGPFNDNRPLQNACIFCPQGGLCYSSLHHQCHPLVLSIFKVFSLDSHS